MNDKEFAERVKHIEKIIERTYTFEGGDGQLSAWHVREALRELLNLIKDDR